MVALDTVRASNAKLKKLPPGLVAVFVGATSGIGESTLKQFCRNTVRPRVYFVGRSQQAADRIISELKSIAPEAEVNYIRKDVSLLKNVDEVCSEITAKEIKLNLLFMTCAVLSMKGRNETSEGLDSKLTTNYYARMRFTTQLLTLLKAAPPQFTRVVSVFAPGGEAPLDFSNLDLKHKFSLKNASAYAITMTDFFFEELAKRNPTISFVHCLPGAVHTGFAKEAPLAVRAGLKAAVTLLVPLKVEINESGERHLYVSTSAAYPPLGGEAAGVEVGSEKVKKGSAGEVGSGAYLLGMHGEFRGKEKVLNELRAQNAGPKIWEHTMQTFTAVRG